MTAKTAKKVVRASVGKDLVSKILQKARSVESSTSRTYHGKETGFTLAHFCTWLFENNETDRHSEATLLSVLLAEFSGNEEFDKQIAEAGAAYVQTLRTRFNYGILSSTKSRKTPSVFSIPYGDNGKPVTTRGNTLTLKAYLRMIAKRGFGVAYDEASNTFTIESESLVNREVVDALSKQDETKDCEVSFGKRVAKPAPKKAVAKQPAKNPVKKSAKKS